MHTKTLKMDLKPRKRALKNSTNKILKLQRDVYAIRIVFKSEEQFVR